MEIWWQILEVKVILSTMELAHYDLPAKGIRATYSNQHMEKKLVLRSILRSYGRTRLSAERKWWFKKKNKTQWRFRHLFWLNRITENVVLSSLILLSIKRPQQDLVISCNWGFIRIKKKCLELHAWQAI